MNIDKLYNNILSKSRNLEIYGKCNIKDTLQNKILLLLIHFSIILQKIKKENPKLNQKIFDYFFSKIELDLRELGFGDMSINKKMKIMVNKFYSILIDFDKYLNKSMKCKNNLINKSFDLYKNEDLDHLNLIKYFDKFAKMIDLISPADIYNANF